MAKKDLVFYFDKPTPYEMHELGEIQTDFNMSLVVDGTKDSMKVSVFSYSGVALEPNTILYHEATNTFWIVHKDKVERYPNEIGGFIYFHSLQLEGAISLLDSRDMTSIGFTSNNYTVDEFIKRLFHMSTFEWKEDLTINYNGNINSSLLIDYTKSFDNYTPLSALREFLDGYNLVGRLSFNLSSVSGHTYISGATLNIVSKTGQVSSNGVIQMSNFNDTRAIVDTDKSSFGTSVVSNAENVFSTKAKTYPSIGAVKCSSNDYTITSSNAIIRLPSPVYDINWVRMFLNSKFRFQIGDTSSYDQPYSLQIDYELTPFSYDSVYGIINDYITQITNATTLTSDEKEYFIGVLNDSREQIAEKILLASRITLYTGATYNPKPPSGVNTWTYPKDNENFYAPYFCKNVTGLDPKRLFLVSKEERDSLSDKVNAIYWERGKNTISGFDLFHDHKYIRNYNDTDLQSSSSQIFRKGRTGYVSYIEIVGYPANLGHDTNNLLFQVNYLPMSDLKIKYDNYSDREDIQLFNQNGKNVDGVALSKVLSSYVKEIESDSITRYKEYYSFNDIPPIGSLVSNGNDMYVIKNISYDFFINEGPITDVNYYIECEFTMSKYIATKSLMVNPNSNIRDYLIPQTENIDRKQLYRDFYEFDYTESEDANVDTPYMPINKILPVGEDYVETQEHTAIMKLSYEEAYGGDNVQANMKDHYYYQLDTTTYILKKALYEVVNFKDNNIIGYDSQNVNTGFDTARFFTNTLDNVNVPISYTDDLGKVKSIEIAMVNTNDLIEIYNDYISYSGRTYSSSTPIYNRAVFIDSEIYEGGEQQTETVVDTYKTTTSVLTMTMSNNYADPTKKNVYLTLNENNQLHGVMRTEDSQTSLWENIDGLEIDPIEMPDIQYEARVNVENTFDYTGDEDVFEPFTDSGEILITGERMAGTAFTFPYTILSGKFIDILFDYWKNRIYLNEEQRFNRGESSSQQAYNGSLLFSIPLTLNCQVIDESTQAESTIDLNIKLTLSQWTGSTSSSSISMGLDSVSYGGVPVQFSPIKYRLSYDITNNTISFPVLIDIVQTGTSTKVATLKKVNNVTGGSLDFYRKKYYQKVFDITIEEIELDRYSQLNGTFDYKFAGSTYTGDTLKLLPSTIIVPYENATYSQVTEKWHLGQLNLKDIGFLPSSFDKQDVSGFAFANISMFDDEQTIANPNVFEFVFSYSNGDYLVDIYLPFDPSSAFNGNLYMKADLTDTYQRVFQAFNGALQKHDFMITELNYYKDPIEVPFFEYSCQIDDSRNILIGENILEYGTDTTNFVYSFVVRDSGTLTQWNAEGLNNAIRFVDAANYTHSLEEGAILSYENGELKIELHALIGIDYNDTTHQIDNIEPDNIAYLRPSRFVGKDVAIYRHNLSPNALERDGEMVNYAKANLMFVLKNVPSSVVHGEGSAQSIANITLKVNHYKLK